MRLLLDIAAEIGFWMGIATAGWIVWVAFVLIGRKVRAARFRRQRRLETSRQLHLITSERLREQRVRAMALTGTADAPKWHPPQPRSTYEGEHPPVGGPNAA